MSEWRGGKNDVGRPEKQFVLFIISFDAAVAAAAASVMSFNFPIGQWRWWMEWHLSQSCPSYSAKSHCYSLLARLMELSEGTQKIDGI